MVVRIIQIIRVRLALYYWCLIQGFRYDTTLMILRHSMSKLKIRWYFKQTFFLQLLHSWILIYLSSVRHLLAGHNYFFHSCGLYWVSSHSVALCISQTSFSVRLESVLYLSVLLHMGHTMALFCTRYLSHSWAVGVRCSKQWLF